MTHRPYPNHERARRQVERHRKTEEQPAAVPNARQAGERLTAALSAAQPSVGDYRLSTRRGQ